MRITTLDLSQRAKGRPETLSVWVFLPYLSARLLLVVFLKDEWTLVKNEKPLLEYIPFGVFMLLAPLYVVLHKFRSHCFPQRQPDLS